MAFFWGEWGQGTGIFLTFVIIGKGGNGGLGEGTINLRSTLDCMVQCPPSWCHQHQAHCPPGTWNSPLRKGCGSCHAGLSFWGQGVSCRPGGPDPPLLLPKNRVERGGQRNWSKLLGAGLPERHKRRGGLSEGIWSFAPHETATHIPYTQPCLQNAPFLSLGPYFLLFPGVAFLHLYCLVQVCQVGDQRSGSQCG